MSTFETPLTLRPLAAGAQYVWLSALATLAFAAIGLAQTGVATSLVLVASAGALFVLGVSRVVGASVTALQLNANGSLATTNRHGGRSQYLPGRYRVERMPGFWFFGIREKRSINWIVVSDRGLAHADRVRLIWRLPLH